MSAPNPLRVGFCPGALRPMASGDGLLVRVKPRGGALSPDQAAGLARLAARHGSGAVTLTGRANLQIRGVGPGAAAPLAAALARLGLLDPSPEAEAVRNVLGDPLAGYDAGALLDVGPVVAGLEDRLVRDPALWRLPAKFAWVVDGRGSLPLDAVAADVRFRAVEAEGDPGFAVTLAGDDARAARCAAGAVPAVAASLARAFLELCAAQGEAPHRMRDLVAVRSAAAVFERAGLSHAAVLPAASRVRAAPVGPGMSGARHWLGIAPPFGWFDAAGLAAVARCAAAAGAATLRLTPWRTMLVPGLTGSAVGQLRAELGDALSTDAALILDPADPRLAVAACPGAPACHRATTPVLADAARLASLLDRGGEKPGAVTLHVSGCAKGCAHPSAAALTLVGRDGRYDLVRRGTAGDGPELRGLSVEAAAAMLRHPQPELAR